MNLGIDLGLIVSRYFLYIFIAIEVLFLPKIVSNEIYVQIEYQKYILFMLPFILLGAPSGYVYFKYNHKKEYYNSLLFFGILIGMVLSLYIYIDFKNLLFAITSLIMILFLIIEQKLKTDKKFFLSLSVKPLISVNIILIASLSFFNYIELFDSINILYYSIIISFSIWISLFFIKKEKNVLKDTTKPLFSEYKLLIKKGFYINLNTILIMTFFFSDRYFTKEYYYEYLGSYSFSYNLSQFVILSLSTIAYVNVVKIGENIKSLNLDYIKGELNKTFKIFIVLFIFFVFFIIIVNNFYSFNNLIEISLIICLFLGIFHSFGAISSLAQYLDFQKELTTLMFCILMVNFVLSYILSHLNIHYLILLTKSGILLTIYSIYFYFKLKNVVDKKENL